LKNIYKVLEGVYNNLELRRTVVPLFMGKTGIGKTHIIRKFAEDKGVHLELFLTSSKPPFEIDGIGVPNTKRTQAVHIEFENILKLKDGDILFFDEMPNGLLPTLNASLTLLESRITAAGRKLPDIMIVAAGNKEGMTPMTPQIKERFLWYDTVFDAKMWKEYMFKKYGLVNAVSNKLVSLITAEDYSTYNFCTPRSIDKAVNMIINDIFTPYEVLLKPILTTLIENKTENPVKLNDERELLPGENIPWLDLIRLNKNISIFNIEEEGLGKTKHYEILMLDENDNIIGEIENIEKLKLMYHFSEQALKDIERGVKISPTPRTALASLSPSLFLFFSKKNK